MNDQRTNEQDLEFDSLKEARRISRRRFFSRLGWGSFALAVVGFFGGLAAYFFPNSTTEPSQAFTVGRPSDYQLGDMVLNQSQKVYIFYDKIYQNGVEIGQGFQAVSGVCTHLGCSYKPFGPPDQIPNPDGSQYKEVHAHCPCHGSIFARDGQVLGGPAPRPLPFYQLSLTADGRLRVDKAVNDLSDALSKQSSEGVGHNIYLTVDGRQLAADLPTGKDCVPCLKE
jgi:cytochrome b6-f complex iron-sulfur subunit